MSKEHRIPIQVSKILRILEGGSGNPPVQSNNSTIRKITINKHQSPEELAAPQVSTTTENDAVNSMATTVALNTLESTPTNEFPVHGVNNKEDVILREVVETPLPVSVEANDLVEPKVVVGEPNEATVPFTVQAVEVPSVVSSNINAEQLHVAYFCMEMGIDNNLPFYAGGLGVLAGDMLKSCADLDVPVIGVSLLYRDGFFTQQFDESGWQIESTPKVEIEKHLELLPYRVVVNIEGRQVFVQAWRYSIVGVKGRVNSVIFLDTDIATNTDADRSITRQLYMGDHIHRIKQEAVLGIAGLEMLKVMGATQIKKFHMNEGHSAFLTVELYKAAQTHADPIEHVRSQAVFTTHTPIAAGHDKFSRDEVDQVLGKDYVPHAIAEKVYDGNTLNMTKLGFELSGHINGVAKRHGEVTREMFPGYHINSITNGVYARTWVGEPLQQLYKKYLPDWENDPYSLRYALSIPLDELWYAHLAAKRDMVAIVKERTGVDFDEEVFTIGFARRATQYKRPELFWSDLGHLKRIAAKYPKGIQIIYSGKAHPQDHEGKLAIQRVKRMMNDIGGNIKAVYIPNYDMDIAHVLVAGVDLWLNTPTRPQEASGTSGMKAALNGVPQLSVLDGWWIEGCIEHVTGWSIGPHPEERRVVSEDEDREDMYTKLEYVILPRFYEERDTWVRMMRHAIAINGSFFNTHRMVEQYVLTAYFN